MKTLKLCISLAILFAMSLSMQAGCGQTKDNNDDTPFSYSNGIAENGFWEGVHALDYIDSFQYKGISIPNDVHNATGATILGDLEYVLNNQTPEALTTIDDRAVIDGDVVNIDYVGSVDGVNFDGGNTDGNGYFVVLGYTSFIDDFLEQLIGHEVGDTFDVEVTFPEVYENSPDLAGKDAVFVTTINYIIDPAEIIEELQLNAIDQYLYDYMTTGVTVRDIPDHLIDYQKNAMLQYYHEGADYYGMEFEEFLTSQLQVSSEEELIENEYNNMVSNAGLTLVIQAVAEDAGLSVNDSDVALAFPDPDNFSYYEESSGMPWMYQRALTQKVYEYLVENAILE